MIGYLGCIENILKVRRIANRNKTLSLIEECCGNNDASESLLKILRSLPESIRIEAILICAKRILRTDLEAFWEIANMLYPSYWFVKLMCFSMQSLRLRWNSFYRAALSAINAMKMGYRSISYASLSESLVSIDRIETRRTLDRAINLLPFSYSSVVGGSALIICRVLRELNLSTSRYLLALANTIGGLRSLDPASKVDILTRIALAMQEPREEILDIVVGRIFSLIPKVDPMELVDLEITVANMLATVFADQEDKLLGMGSRYDSDEIRRIIKHAIMRILRVKGEKLVLNVCSQDRGKLEIMEEVEKTLRRRAELRKKLATKLSEILVKQNFALY